MKLLAAACVYLRFAALLGAGILAVAHGKPLLLIFACLIYVVMLARIGCTAH